MKICVTGLRGIPNVVGGIESHCEQILSRISKNHPQLEIVVFARKAYVNDFPYEFANIKVIPIWSLRSLYLETIIHTLISLLYAKFKIRADLLHIHAIGPGILTPLAYLLGIPTIVTCHGADYERDKWNKFAKLFLRIGESLSIRFSNGFICVGESLTRELQKKYPKHSNRIYFIPNGFKKIANIKSENICTDEILNKLGIENSNYILTVGRFVPEKGFNYLIDAFKKSRTTHKLVIVGDEYHPTDFSRSLYSEKSDKIIFTGFRSGEELYTLYNSASLFVLPSFLEGLPIVVLEALSAHLPVILSDIAPNKDINLPAQCYFQVGNVDQLTDKLSVDDYSSYRVHNNDIFHQYDWNQISEQTYDLYIREVSSQIN